jgi:ferric-dicitrate binding protein FerR (iron transport regulator)
MDPTGDEDEIVRKLMGAAGARPAPPQALQDKWVAHFRSELAVELRKKRARRQRAAAVGIALAATLALVVGVRVPKPDPTKGEPIGRVARISGHLEGPRSISLRPGTDVHSGDALRTPTSGRAALAIGDVEVRLDAATAITMLDRGVRLETGSIYVDTRGTSNRDFLVQTTRGSVTHLGTQYLVSVRADTLTVGVREGKVALSVDASERILENASEGAMLATVDASGVTLSLVPMHGGIWEWVPAMAAPLSIEGRSAHELLDWLGRETGRKVEYANERVEAQARAAILKGDVVNPALDGAVELLNATTRLSVTVDAASGALHVDAQGQNAISTPIDGTIGSSPSRSGENVSTSPISSMS